MRSTPLYVLAVFVLISCSERPKAPVDPLRPNQSWAYPEGILWWDSLADFSKYVTLRTFGKTDAGLPLHLVIYSAEEMSLEAIGNSKKLRLLINNAIHPGEPDGVDASMAFYRDLALRDHMAFEDMIIVCIPYFNVGGSLNRNSHSRANQDGPREYGFRGNAQNLDLNRDFVKMDSRNAMSFAQLIELIDPDVYLETHVSNGADYTYTITYLPTQADKLGYGMGGFMRKRLNPALENIMEQKGHAMVPYVNVHGMALDSSYTGFYDSPRYSTGLMSLRQCFSYITETHMLKPYDQRVEATLAFIESLCQLASKEARAIQSARHSAKMQVAQVDSLPLDWEIDSSRIFRYINFNGYAPSYKSSYVHGEDRLFYDTSKPVKIRMKHYDYYSPSIVRSKPEAYVVKGGYHQVVERLKLLGVNMRKLDGDSTITGVISYRISSFETASSPYEKHYYHFNTVFSRDTVDWTFHPGDVIIECHTDRDRIILELLEPDGPDSYFNWNFFDAVLQQKEWYSPYVFEDKAHEYLSSDDDLRREFTDRLKTIPAFNENPQWQLHWIFQQSPHYEKEHMRLPVFRLE